jgi:hypothetical protein
MVSTHNVLVRAIRYAEANDRVGRNVASLVKPPQGKTGRQEQDALQRGQDPHRPQHPQPPGHRGLQPDRDRGAGRDLPAPLPLVRRRQAGITSPAARCGVRKNAAQVSSTRRATACSSSSSRLCSDGRSSGLLPSLTKPPVWPADGGEPDPTGHPDDNIAQPGIGRHAPDQVPVTAVRAAHHPHRTGAAVHIVMRHMPASTSHGPLAQCPKTPGADAGGRSRAAARRLSPPSSQPRPITVPAALTNGRCRTQPSPSARRFAFPWSAWPGVTVSHARAGPAACRDRGRDRRQGRRS